MPLVIRANLITVQSNVWTYISTQEGAHLHLFLLLFCWLVLHRLDNVVFYSSSLTRSTEKKKEKCLCGKVWSMKVNRPLGNQVEQLQRRSWVMSRLLWRNAGRYSSKSRLDWSLDNTRLSFYQCQALAFDMSSYQEEWERRRELEADAPHQHPKLSRHSCNRPDCNNNKHCHFYNFRTNSTLKNDYSSVEAAQQEPKPEVEFQSVKITSLPVCVCVRLCACLCVRQRGNTAGKVSEGLEEWSRKGWAGF